MRVQQGFNMPFLKDRLVSHPAPLRSSTTCQATGPCLRSGRSTCVALSYTHSRSLCSFPFSPWKAGKPLSDLPGWWHLGSVRSIPAPATFAQLHPSLHSPVQVTHQSGSTEKFTPELWKHWFYELRVQFFSSTEKNHKDYTKSREDWQWGSREESPAGRRAGRQEPWGSGSLSQLAQVEPTHTGWRGRQWEGSSNIKRGEGSILNK